MSSVDGLPTCLILVVDKNDVERTAIDYADGIGITILSSGHFERNVSKMMQRALTFAER